MTISSDSISTGLVKGRQNPRLDDGYVQFRGVMHHHFFATTEQEQNLFRTDAADGYPGGLYELFLKHLPGTHKQHYDCRCCRDFVDSYGALVVISDQGVITPVLWPAPAAFVNVPDLFARSVASLYERVRHAKVIGVHRTDERVWGTPLSEPKSGPYKGQTWSHLHVVPPKQLVFVPTVARDAYQAQAEKTQDYGMIRRSLGEYPIELVRQAHHLLTSDVLYRSEKCIHIATWLLETHEKLAVIRDRDARTAFLWKVTAEAAQGFAHVRNTMIGTLLDDIKRGLSLVDIKANFDKKMAPDKYMRPQAAPSTGNLVQAEKLVSEMGVAGSLKRRYATMNDLRDAGQLDWEPSATKELREHPRVDERLDVFSGLSKPRTVVAEAGHVPQVRMTWVKFVDKILGDASAMSFYVPFVKSSYGSVLTAEDMSAPPILKWDHLGARNPFSWYVYTKGSLYSNWGLVPGRWVDVTGVWSIFTSRALLILKGARDINKEPGMGLFPENLKPEFHSIRQSIEAYSQAHHPSGLQFSDVNGLMLRSGDQGWPGNVALMVTDSRGNKTQVDLDRWD